MPANSAERLRRLHTLALALREARQFSARSSCSVVSSSASSQKAIRKSPAKRRRLLSKGVDGTAECGRDRDRLGSLKASSALFSAPTPRGEREKCAGSASAASLSHAQRKSSRRLEPEHQQRASCSLSAKKVREEEAASKCETKSAPLFCRVPPPSAYATSARVVTRRLAAFHRLQRSCFAEAGVVVANREVNFAEGLGEGAAAAAQRKSSLQRRRLHLLQTTSTAEGGVRLWRGFWVHSFQERYRALRQTCLLQTRLRALLPRLLLQNLQAAAVAGDLSEVAVCASALEQVASLNKTQHGLGGVFVSGEEESGRAEDPGSSQASWELLEALALNCKSVLSAAAQCNAQSQARDKAGAAALSLMKRLRRLTRRALASTLPSSSASPRARADATCRFKELKAAHRTWQWTGRLCRALRSRNFVRAFKLIKPLLLALPPRLGRSASSDAEDTLSALALALLPALQKACVFLLLEAGPAHWRRNSGVYADAAEKAAVLPPAFSDAEHELKGGAVACCCSSLLRDRALRESQLRASARRQLKALPPRVAAQLLFR